MHWPGFLENVSDHQLEQCKIATAGNIGILTGGPGTGKTHVTARLVRSILMQHMAFKGIERLGGGSGKDFDSLPVAVCAPTGKAASRIQGEIKQAAGVAMGSTIHSLLGATRGGYDGGGWSFTYNSSNPLPYEFVIVDEASMVDTLLMSHLIKSIKIGGKLLLVGDTHQLPPVGRGKPMYDLIRAGVPNGNLTEIRRQGGLIARNCAAIRNNEPWEPAHRTDLDGGGDPDTNHVHVHAGSPSSAIRSMVKIVKTLLERGWDKHEIQVITSLNGKGRLSQHELNKVLQECINPKLYDEQEEVNGIRLNDRIICTKNQVVERMVSDAIGPPVAAGPVYVANGDTGIANHVAVLNDHKTREIQMKIDSMEKGGWSKFTGASTEDLKLAYAITTHKSQGSQWPIVIMMIDDSYQASMVRSRNLYYTGLSRASVCCFTIGKLSVLRETCNTALDLDARKTFLAETVKELVKWYDDLELEEPF